MGLMGRENLLIRGQMVVGELKVAHLLEEEAEEDFQEMELVARMVLEEKDLFMEELEVLLLMEMEVLEEEVETGIGGVEEEVGILEEEVEIMIFMGEVEEVHTT